MSAITVYVAALRQSLASGLATEHTYRPALKALLEELKAGVQAHNEPRHTDAGAVDFIVKKGEQPLGWLEAKDIGADLNKIAKTDQLKRYLGAYPNLILTDYVNFKLYLGGVCKHEASLGVVDGAKLTTSPDKQAQVEALLATFLTQEVYRTGKPGDLASRMAYLARMAEDAIIGALKQEGNKGQLHSQMAAFKETLLPDLTEAQFADMYAQTIAYGLFAAKCNHPLGDDFNRFNAVSFLPPTNPFLRRLFHELTGPDLDEAVVWVVDGLVSLLRWADMAEILSTFAKHQQGREDPVVHFYETFLKEYNPKERKIRGVYYTPEPVVSYIVRSVDHLLKTEFDKPLGLADPEVFILDPACGTGTFLYFVIEHIHHTITQHYGKDAWPAYVRENLLRRVFGFELLMAPYTIAHLKLGMLLQDQGYDFPDDQRLGVYMTNTLEAAKKRSQSLVARYISEESEAAADVKREKPIMVVLGNPPYAGHSANASTREEIDVLGRRRTVKTWIGGLIEDYKMVDGHALGERNAKWLQDDYVKFMRFGEWRIEKTGHGILAFITNHGYLDNPTFRGMRQRLTRVFPRVSILDLHGNSKKKERAPGGGEDENVFDIQQGVAIGLFRRPAAAAIPDVTQQDLFGLRAEKYGYLDANDISTTDWHEVIPQAPSYTFVPLSSPILRDEYEEFWTVPNLLSEAGSPTHGIGVCTHNDSLLTDIDRGALERRFLLLENPSVSDADVSSELGLEDGKYWKMERERRKVRSYPWRKMLLPYLYRPFTWNWIVYEPDLMEIGRGGASKPVMQHLVAGGNIALLSTRQTRDPFGALVTDGLCSHKSLSAYDGTYAFPLYRHASEDSIEQGARRPNLNPAFTADLSARIGLSFIGDGKGDLAKTFGPEDVFHYIYAILHSPTYRSRYAEFLKVDFPRIPLTSDLDLFRNLCALGEELVALHLLKSPSLANSPAKFDGPGDRVIEAVGYDESSRKVLINKAQGFIGISKTLYEFQVGGYQVLNKWLKDRKGRELSFEDIDHYLKTAAALNETLRLMREIDEAIPSWPVG